MPTKGVIYYTENRLNEKIANKCRTQLRESFSGEIVSCSLKPINFGDTKIVINAKPSYFTMFTQIYLALQSLKADIVFFCEHDVLYHLTHFEFTPQKKDVFYYNRNWWKTRDDGYSVHWDADQVSGLCVYKEKALEFYQHRLQTFDENNFDRKFEPMSGHGSDWWKSKYPNVDVRHNKNLTYNKWKLDHFRKKETALNFQSSTIENIPGWQLKLKDVY